MSIERISVVRTMNKKSPFFSNLTMPETDMLTTSKVLASPYTLLFMFVTSTYSPSASIYTNMCYGMDLYGIEIVTRSKIVDWFKFSSCNGYPFYCS